MFKCSTLVLLCCTVLFARSAEADTWISCKGDLNIWQNGRIIERRGAINEIYVIKEKDFYAYDEDSRRLSLIGGSVTDKRIRWGECGADPMCGSIDRLDGTWALNFYSPDNTIPGVLGNCRKSKALPVDNSDKKF